MIHLAEFVVIHNMRHEAIVLSEAEQQQGRGQLRASCPTL